MKKTLKPAKAKVKSVDPKYLGIPNIQFSLTDRTDTREPELAQQRISRGFDDSETWCLSSTVAKFIVPRLERFIEITNDTVVKTKEIKKMELDCLIAFQLIIRDDGSWEYTKAERKQVKRGLKLFSKNFMYFWW